MVENGNISTNVLYQEHFDNLSEDTNYSVYMYAFIHLRWSVYLISSLITAITSIKYGVDTFVKHLCESVTLHQWAWLGNLLQIPFASAINIREWCKLYQLQGNRWINS